MSANIFRIGFEFSNPMRFFVSNTTVIVVVNFYNTLAAAKTIKKIYS